MSSFSTTTNAYKLIRKLAALRQANDAIAYGTWKQRWMNNDVYIYERQFFNDVVLVAINKSDSASISDFGPAHSAAAGHLLRLSRRTAGWKHSDSHGRQRSDHPADNFTIASA